MVEAVGAAWPGGGDCGGPQPAARAMSPGLIQPRARMSSLIPRVSSAGMRIWKTTMRAMSRPVEVEPDIVWKVMIWPTSPAEPMPEPMALDCMPSTIVVMGPKIAEARVGGTQMRRWRTIMGT